ncbi:MAG: PAS domain-containing protein [Anaerolineae bacterium]|nr:PAS domain-containing protein [Anaerolineae bacterium]
MLRWFAPPTLKDEFESFAVRTLHYTLLLLIIVAAAFLIFATTAAQIVFIPIVLLLFGLCYYLTHTGHHQTAKVLFLSGLRLVITIAAFSQNGLRNASISSYAIVIIFSAILISDRAVLVVAGLCMLSVIILAVGETQGLLPLRTTPLYLPDRLFQQVALFGASGVLLSTASRVIRSYYARIRQSEQTLLERNRQLENEIIERQRVEAALRASEETYRILFENIGLMCGVYDRSGSIVLMNQPAARFLDATPAALHGKMLQDVLSAADVERMMEQQTRAMDTGTTDIVEGKTTLPDGKAFYYLRHVVPLPHPVDERGKPAHVLVITTDLTEQKLAEQQERELVLAKEKNAFLTDFLNTVSHDLKTPITVLKTSLYLLERMQDAEQRQRRLAVIKAQLALLETFIQDTLTISRLEYLPTLDIETLDINQMLETVVDALYPRLEKKQITCQLNTPPKPLHLSGDEGEIRRALVNLIENAINYTPSGGRIIVSAQIEGETVVLEVADNGIGIKPTDIPHIFDRFYRSPEARIAESSGTGLGLAIVKKIVDMHHGVIEIASEPGHGTSFRIQLPIGQPLL